MLLDVSAAQQVRYTDRRSTGSARVRGTLKLRWNERSAQVARRVGFVHEGTYVDSWRAADDTLATGLCFRMLRSEADQALGRAEPATAMAR